MSDYRDLAARISAWNTTARYEWPIVAAARLVAGSHLLLWKVGPFVDSDGWIEWQHLADHVDVSAWSSGEKAALRLACSIAGYAPVTGQTPAWLLEAMLAPLDRNHSELAADAVRFAALGPGRR